MPSILASSERAHPMNILQNKEMKKVFAIGTTENFTGK